MCHYLSNENIHCFCDNKKAGKSFHGIPIISYDELKKIYCDYTVVIALEKAVYIAEVIVRLLEDNIPFVMGQQIANSILEKDIQEYTSLNKRSTFRYEERNNYIISRDKYDYAGSIGSYFWQDLWAAKHIFESKPSVHSDIGSRIDGFIAHLLSFGQKVQLFDIRPLDADIYGMEFVQCDATNLSSVPDDSLESLSALCSIEHFGLGRYNDPIDPEACFKCFDAIQSKMRKGGMVYLSVPIGKEHVEFNAHRVFYASTIKDSFPKMKLLEFSSAYKDKMEYNVDLNKYDKWTEYGGERFGLFRFVKE